MSAPAPRHYMAEMAIDLFSCTRSDEALHPQFLTLRMTSKWPPQAERWEMSLRI